MSHTRQMSSTDSLDDHAVGANVRSVVGGGSHPFHHSLATYRYENALVKTELAATLERHSREMEELRLKYESKVCGAGSSQSINFIDKLLLLPFSNVCN